MQTDQWQPTQEQPIQEQPAHKSSTLTVVAICIAATSLVLGAAGLIFGLTALRNLNGSNASVVSSSDTYYTGNSAEFESTSIAAIAAKLTPAVVSIVTESIDTSDYFYNTTASAGTGMIVSADGYILTNKHVISDASQIQVITDAGDTYDDVEIVAIDPLNDVAYLKINHVSNLPTVSLGDSKTIATGQPVLAVGNALGAYQNTVTEGIISGTGRSLEASLSEDSDSYESLIDMIQTDAAINPGNSGGPLVNAAGDVIGINTAVSTEAQGMGFAIPISAVKGMLSSITSTGSAERAYMGLQYVPVTANIAKSFDLSVNEGAFIYSGSRSSSSAVVQNGPADKAGIKEGDVITKINGITVGKAGSISTLVGEYKVGDTIAVVYVRGDETREVQVTLGAYPASGASSQR